MAKVEFISPIEALHGKIKKSDKIGYARKTIANIFGERTKYTQSYGQRTTPVTTAEKAQRTRFGAICAAVAARRQNASTKATDLANFRQQSYYKTFNQYIWHVCADIYDNAE